MLYRTCRTLLIALLITGIVLTLQPVQPAAAALTVFTVDTTAQRNSAGDLPTNCTLGDAIVAANNDAPEDGCTHANIGTGGPFEIVLAASTTYTLDTVDNVTDGENGLPSITSTITIMGSSATITRTGAATFRIFHMAAPANLILDNLTVSNGVADDGGISGNYGGGIYNNGGALTIQNGSVISGNSAQHSGGGIVSYGLGSTLNVLSSSLITGNQARVFGGGILADDDTTATIAASMVAGNMAESGAGLYCWDCNSMSIEDCTFDSNNAAISGAAVGNRDGTVEIRNSTFSNNRATSGSGAGIITWSNIPGITVTVTIDNSTFTGNVAGNRGGAIRNACPAGTALVYLNNVTIFNNSAAHGGGLYDDCGVRPAVEYTNSIIAGNTSPDGTDCFVDSFVGAATTSNGNNLFTTAGNFGGGGANDCGSAASDIVVPTVADLNLAPLANYGGLTQTHALLFDSPAIDAGNNGTCVAGGDQRYEPRVDRDGNGVATCDIGAYEYAPALAFNTQPGCAAANDPLNPQPVMRFIDPNSGSATDTYVDGTNNITMALVPPAGGATLNGTNPQNVVAGLATFTDLSVDLDGTYQFRATANMLGLTANTVDSANFTIPCSAAPAPSSSGGAAPIITASDPAISKLGAPQNVTIGESVIWTIVISNPGTMPTGTIFVNDPIPNMLDIVNATTTRGTTTITGQVVTVDTGILAPGESVTITIETVGNHLAQPGELCNTATAANVSATACVTLFPDNLPATGGQPSHWKWWLFAAIVLVAVGGAWLRRRSTS